MFQLYIQFNFPICFKLCERQSLLTKGEKGKFGFKKTVAIVQQTIQYLFNSFCSRLIIQRDFLFKCHQMKWYPENSLPAKFQLLCNIVISTFAKLSIQNWQDLPMFTEKGFASKFQHTSTVSKKTIRNGINLQITQDMRK